MHHFYLWCGPNELNYRCELSIQLIIGTIEDKLEELPITVVLLHKKSYQLIKLQDNLLPNLWDT